MSGGGVLKSFISCPQYTYLAPKKAQTLLRSTPLDLNHLARCGGLLLPTRKVFQARMRCSTTTHGLSLKLRSQRDQPEIYILTGVNSLFPSLFEPSGTDPKRFRLLDKVNN